METEARRNPERHRYELADSDGVVSVAEYREIDGVVVFTHTETREELRGRGLAEKLVRFALEDVRAMGKSVMPRCAFVRDFIVRHPQYNDVLAA